MVNYEQKFSQPLGCFPATFYAARDGLSQQLESQQRYLDSLQDNSPACQEDCMQVVLSVTSKCWMQNVPLFATNKPFSILQLRQVNEINLFTALGGGWVE